MADDFLFDTTVTSALLNERHPFRLSTKAFIDGLGAGGDFVVLSSIWGWIFNAQENSVANFALSWFGIPPQMLLHRRLPVSSEDSSSEGST